jgi:probable F420-dependent oxidoreductase
MKIRIGLSLGAAGISDTGAWRQLLSDLERLRFDSLWLSDVPLQNAPEPMATLAFCAGATQRMKLGTSVLVLPGRNPLQLAREMATVDSLSGGRFLPAFGLGLHLAEEEQWTRVPWAHRWAWVEEVMPLLRRLLSEENVDHDGSLFQFRSVTLHPRPVQRSMDFWLGGSKRRTLEQIGRLADGWLASLITPAEAGAGRAAIAESAHRAERSVDPEHYGVIVAYARTGIPPAYARTIATRRPTVDPGSLVPIGWPAVRDAIEAFIDQGISKFVVRPVEAPASWTAELEELAAEVLPLQT